MVADWDRTLTTAHTLTGRDQSTYAVIHDGGYLGPDYQRRSEMLYRTYRESERSANIDVDTKVRQMEQWWALQFDLMLEFGFSSDVIDRAILDDHVRIRKGSLDLIKALSDHDVPLLILSAGITPFITRYLKHNGALAENVRVAANELAFDADGRAIGYHKPLIHSLNKHRPDLKPPDHLATVSSRPNLILMGDTLEDVQAASGLPHRSKLCFGFPESSSHPSLDAFLLAYDLVVPDDGPATPVLELVRRVVGH